MSLNARIASLLLLGYKNGFLQSQKKKKNLILLMECNLSKKTRKSNKLIQSHDIKFIHSSMGHGMEKKNLAKLS